MADIADFRRNVQIEETRYKAAVSESSAQKIGAAVNFINNRQFDTHSFLINGDYALGAGTQGTDGIYICPFNMEIVAIGFFNVEKGTSGTTTFDIHKLSASSVDDGSIFGTKAAIDSTALNHAFGLKGLIDSIGDFDGTGVFLPTVTTTEINQGEALRFDLNLAMSGAKNAGITIYFRPRN